RLCPSARDFYNEQCPQPARAGIPAIDRYAHGLQPDRDRRAGAARVRLYGQAFALPVPGAASRPSRPRCAADSFVVPGPRRQPASPEPVNTKLENLVTTVFMGPRVPSLAGA